jgi:hypothetical protein
MTDDDIDAGAPNGICVISECLVATELAGA